MGKTRKILYVLVLTLSALTVTSSITRASTPAPDTDIHILWLDDTEPGTVGHNMAISVGLGSTPDRVGTFYVYEGATVPGGSPAPLATLEITNGGDNEAFVSISNVGAATRFSIKYVPSNASYTTTNFENIRARCGSGTFSSSGFGPCTKAPPGSYSIDYGATAPISCPAGTYQSNTGAISCLLAPAGSYVPNSGASAATLCPIGTFAENTESLLCNAAPLAKFVNILGATAAIPCPSGFTTSGMAASVCHQIQDALISVPSTLFVSTTSGELTMSFSSSPAVAGTLTVYQSAHIVGSPSVAGTKNVTVGTTSVSIPLTFDTSEDPRFSIKFESSNSNHNTTYWENLQASCPVGFYSVYGQTPCTVAPAGTYVSEIASSSVTECQPGTYQPSTGKTSCLPAPAGTYVASKRATEATPCPSGTFTSQQGLTTASACTVATAGNYVADSDRTRQLPCATGTFQSKMGQSSCVSARIGYFVNKVGATTESRCKRRFTTSTIGSTSCKRSPSIPKLSTQLSRTKFSTVYLNGGRNVDGLPVKISTTTKACKVSRDPLGYKLLGISRGKCVVTISIQGNKSFASISATRTIRVL